MDYFAISSWASQNWDDGELNCKYWLLVVSMMYHLSLYYAYFRLRWLARMLTFYRSKHFSEVTMCNQGLFSHLLRMPNQEEIMRTRCLTRCGINVTRNSYSGTNFMSSVQIDFVVILFIAFRLKSPTGAGRGVERKLY